jgi:hypothetical protein
MSGIISGPARAIALLAVLPLSGLGFGLPVNTVYAEDCLAAPNSTAPQGSHWYYHIDRAKKLKCWYLHALDQSGQQSAAGASAGVSVGVQSTDTQSTSLPVPSIRAPISLLPADSARPLKKLAVKPPPLTNTIRNADAEPSWQEGSAAPSTPEARALQDSSQPDGSNHIIKSAALDATPDADVEWKGREGSPTASILQTPVLQKDAPHAEGSNAPPMSAMPVATPDADEGSALESSAASPFPQAPIYTKPVIGKSAEPAEEIGKAYARPKSDDQSSDTAESAVEHIALGNKSNISSVGPPVAILMFGMALAGLLFGVVSIIVGERHKRVADRRKSNLIDDRKQLDGRECNLEAALLANMMTLAHPGERSNFVRLFPS